MVDKIEDINVGYYIRNGGYNSIAESGKKSNVCCNTNGNLHDAMMNDQFQNWLKNISSHGGWGWKSPCLVPCRQSD